MRRLNSTLIVVVGEGAEQVIAELGALHNVRAIDTKERTPAELTEIAAKASTTYVVHDLDPLAEVRDAWVNFFDQASPAGRLEVAIETTIRAFHSEMVLMPDYYVVLDPEDLPPTQRHWWLGVLAGTAPARVVPAPATPHAVRASVANLIAGRWWPEPADEWLRGLPRVVPDRAGLGS